jgi:hypothetical protein
MRSKAPLAGLILLLSGCALIRQGTTQTVTIESKPPKAEFQINGEGEWLRTPYTVTLPKEEHKLKFKAIKGFRETDKVLQCRTSSYFYWSLLFGVLAGGVDWISGAWKEFETQEDGVTALFELERSDENLEQVVLFSSDPSGANIKINKIDHPGLTGTKGKGGTPIIVVWKDDSEREKTVTMNRLHYFEGQTVLRRGDKHCHIVLEAIPEESTVQFESIPSGAEVLVDGIPIDGVTPVAKTFKWKPGDTLAKKVIFRKVGYLPDPTFTVETIKDKNTARISGRLIPDVKWVALKVTCAPAGAELEVDGTPVGDSLAEIKLDWSVIKTTHKLKLSRPGYESQEITIRDTQKDVPVTIRLKPSLPRLP